VEHWSSCGFIQDAPLRSNVTEPASWGSAAPGGGRRARAPLHLLVCNSAERLFPPGRVGGRRSLPPSHPYSAMAPKRSFRCAQSLRRRTTSANRRLALQGRASHAGPSTSPTPQLGKTVIRWVGHNDEHGGSQCRAYLRGVPFMVHQVGVPRRCAALTRGRACRSARSGPLATLRGQHASSAARGDASLVAGGRRLRFYPWLARNGAQRHRISHAHMREPGRGLSGDSVTRLC
jgi:hypothetical protein